MFTHLVPISNLSPISEATARSSLCIFFLFASASRALLKSLEIICSRSRSDARLSCAVSTLQSTEIILPTSCRAHFPRFGRMFSIPAESTEITDSSGAAESPPECTLTTHGPAVFEFAVPTLRSVRASLVELSRRHSRIADEVEDLAHDLIESAFRRGLSLEGESFLHSAHGAARRHAAFLARSAVRRRAREARWAADEALDLGSPSDDGDVEGAPLSRLSPALRTTLFLLVLGLEKPELRAALGLTDAALRKRLQALRAHAPLARPSFPLPPRTLARAQVRRTLVTVLTRLAGQPARDRARRILGASDPDGHGLIFGDVLTSEPGTATLEVPCSAAKSKTSASSSSSPTSLAPGASTPKPSV